MPSAPFAVVRVSAKSLFLTACWKVLCGMSCVEKRLPLAARRLHRAASTEREIVMSQLFKECELRRFVEGRVERAISWLAADEADIGRVVLLPSQVDDDFDEWEIVSAPDPALPASVVELFEADTLSV